MAYILNIETATKNCSVSIAKDGETLLCKEGAEQGYSHAEKLHVFIKEALHELHLDFSDLTAIAVSQGPGSYTGLRIGVSAAKGLCYALDISMIAVDTLEILASQLDIRDGIIVPMIDARRMEVFTSFFDPSKLRIKETEAVIIDADSYSEINQNLHLIGDGAMKFKEILTDEKFIFYPEIIYPSSKEMSKISFEKYKRNDTVDVAYFEPFYLKDFMMK